MIFLAELSITQRALMRHEGAIMSTDNCIFLLRNKVPRAAGNNLTDLQTNGLFPAASEKEDLRGGGRV